MNQSWLETPILGLYIMEIAKLSISNIYNSINN